jgi:hypothetical protein
MSSLRPQNLSTTHNGQLSWGCSMAVDPVPGTGHSVMAIVVKNVSAIDSLIALRPQSGT